MFLSKNINMDTTIWKNIMGQTSRKLALPQKKVNKRPKANKGETKYSKRAEKVG